MPPTQRSAPNYKNATILALTIFAWNAWIFYSSFYSLFYEATPQITPSNESFLLFLRYADVIKVLLYFGIPGYAYFYAPQFPRQYRAIVTTWYTIFLVMALSTIILTYGLAYRSFGIIDNSQINNRPDPITCLYFSLTTWTGFGFGDVVPIPELRLLAASEAFLGYLGMAMVIAFFVQILERFRHAGPRDGREERA